MHHGKLIDLGIPHSLTNPRVAGGGDISQTNMQPDRVATWACIEMDVECEWTGFFDSKSEPKLVKHSLLGTMLTWIPFRSSI